MKDRRQQRHDVFRQWHTRVSCADAHLITADDLLELWHHFHDYLQNTPVFRGSLCSQRRFGRLFQFRPPRPSDPSHPQPVNRWQHTFATPTLTVDTYTTGDPIQLAHIGRHHRKHPTQRTLHTADITTIVALALDSCIFKACNSYFLQVRGAGIGSQLSPALVQCRHHRTLPASTPPFFDRPHRDPFRLYYRYVDNRFIAFNSTFLKHLAIRTLIHPDFLWQPSELTSTDHLLHPT